MVSSETPFADFLRNSAEAHWQRTGKTTEGNLATTTREDRASELQCREPRVQGSTTYYLPLNNGLNQREYGRGVSRIPDLGTHASSQPILPSYSKSSAMLPMESQINEQMNVGCSNPYIYLLPDGTVVDMATGRIYNKQDPNGNTVCSPSKIKTLSSAPPQIPQPQPGVAPSHQLPQPRPVVKKSVPVVVDLTLDDSSDDGEKKDFPKIESTFSLKYENISWVGNDVSGIIGRKENDPANNIFNTSVDKRNIKNDVMIDLTNFHNGEISDMKLPLEKSVGLNHENGVIRSKVLSPWSENSVVDVPPRIANQETPSVSVQRGRAIHRRKAVHKVRQDVSVVTKIETNRLEGVTVSSEGGDYSTGTPWVFSITPEMPKTVQPIARETKIKKLKRLLSKQVKAVEKIRVNGHKATKRKERPKKTLVVQIRDLNTQLRYIAKGKRTFHVHKLQDGRKIVDGISLPRKPRKMLPKFTRTVYTYPSFVSLETIPGLNDLKSRLKAIERVKSSESPRGTPESSDNESECGGNEPKVKRGRGRPPKPKGNRRRRSRNSPLGEGFDNVAVVAKDQWHRELEKVEETLGFSEKSLDQDSYLLFLGLMRS